MAIEKKKGEILSFVDNFIQKDDLPFNKDYLFRNMAIGFFAGMVVAISGAIKDSPYEGFKPGTFIRSPIVGAIACPILGALIPNAHWFLLFLSVIGFERIIIEIHKLFRGKAPGKFKNGEWGTPKELHHPEPLPALMHEDHHREPQNGNGFIHHKIPGYPSSHGLDDVYN